MDSRRSENGGETPPPSGCQEFSLTLAAEEVPEVLRRVATEIEKIPGFQLLNLVVSLCDEEATASVYYWLLDER